MELTEQQKLQLGRLHENESLTDNLTDSDARALLQWADLQIRSDTDGDLVTAAVSAANQSGVEGAPNLLANAAAYLARELEARPSKVQRDKETPANQEMGATEGRAAIQLQSKATSINTSSLAKDNAPTALQATGEVGAAQILSAHADSSIAPPPSTPAPAKKSHRASKRRKKT